MKTADTSFHFTFTFHFHCLEWSREQQKFVYNAHIIFSHHFCEGYFVKSCSNALIQPELYITSLDVFTLQLSANKI